MNIAQQVETQRGYFKKNPLPLPPGNSFVRHITAKAMSRITGEPVRDIAARLWPSDRIVAEILERATAAPAMTVTTGWAAELAQKRVADALDAMGPASAGVTALKAGLVMSFDRAGQISAPGFVASGTNAGFVAEGDPIPVRQLSAGAVLLDHYMMASIAVLTREMIEGSNAEALISDALIRSMGPALDSVLFDSNAATAARPAGLRNGISATTPSNNSDTAMAFIEDAVALINVVAPVGGNGPYIIVANPGRATAMSLRFVHEAANVIVLGSSALGNDIIAIAPNALVTALDPEPVVESSNAASLHMDTAPSVVGSASPHKSMFQTDSVAMKVRWPLTWMLRDARGVAWMTPTWK